MGSGWEGWGIERWLLRWAAGTFDKPVPLCTVLYPFVFPHIFPILLAPTESELAHLLEFARGKGLREVGESGLYRGSPTGEFHLHHLEGEEGISRIPLGLLELLEDV